MAVGLRGSEPTQYLIASMPENGVGKSMFPVKYFLNNESSFSRQLNFIIIITLSQNLGKSGPLCFLDITRFKTVLPATYYVGEIVIFVKTGRCCLTTTLGAQLDCRVHWTVHVISSHVLSDPQYRITQR